MIHNGMSVDAILHGAPCLHWAVHYGHIDLTAALLANGAMVWYGMVWYGLVLAFERARHHHYFHEIYLTSMHSLTCSFIGRYFTIECINDFIVSIFRITDIPMILCRELARTLIIVCRLTRGMRTGRQLYTYPCTMTRKTRKTGQCK